MSSLGKSGREAKLRLGEPRHLHGRKRRCLLQSSAWQIAGSPKSAHRASNTQTDLMFWYDLLISIYIYIYICLSLVNYLVPSIPCLFIYCCSSFLPFFRSSVLPSFLPSFLPAFLMSLMYVCPCLRSIVSYFTSFKYISILLRCLYMYLNNHFVMYAFLY